jgi:hypothetical protein
VSFRLGGPAQPDPDRRSKWLTWWYFSIAAGFFLLAIQRIIIGDVPWRIAARFLLAFGFLVLGYHQSKQTARRR